MNLREQPQKAKLVVGTKEYFLPLVEGTEGEVGIDIRTLRKESGLVTYDPGYVNTANCSSTITFINGEEGILRYRGYPVEELCRYSTFVETCYLLLHNALPKKRELENFSNLLNEHSLVHEDMRRFFNYFPKDAHPMSILATMVAAMSSFYPHVDSQSLTEDIDVSAARLISKVRTLACLAYKKSIGEPVVYPRKEYRYCENFLRMMFWSPVNNYEVDPEHARILNIMLILHADHEQNCSTSTVRMVGSAQANLYAAISAGIAALWGPLHGGANQQVIEMLEQILADKGNIDKYIEMAKDKTKNFRLAGFGHRVYKNYDPRAKITKELCMNFLQRQASYHPLLEVALRLEEKVLQDEYFISRKLYPNVDFYSGLIYRALGFPTNMFTVLFAIGRMPGWIAQWKEMINSPEAKIYRPRQIYVGEKIRHYIPIDQR